MYMHMHIHMFETLVFKIMKSQESLEDKHK